MGLEGWTERCFASHLMSSMSFYVIGERSDVSQTKAKVIANMPRPTPLPEHAVEMCPIATPLGPPHPDAQFPTHRAGHLISHLERSCFISIQMQHS